MKRKKWSEEEEQTLLNTYACLFSPSSSASSSSSSAGSTPISALLPTRRQKRFQPIADRLNSTHHLSDPSSFPHLWSWRDVSIKIHNMRNQYLNVKQKLISTDPNPNLDHALDLWPNFLRYKQVFGDVDLDPTTTGDSDDLYEEDQEYEEDDERIGSRKRKKKRTWRERLRRREERKDEEDMEWMERVLTMQMDHEKQAMQMHADACQSQLQILGILVRVMCQFLGSGPGNGGLGSQVVEDLQEEQLVVEETETRESRMGDNDDGNNNERGYL